MSSDQDSYAGLPVRAFLDALAAGTAAPAAGSAAALALAEAAALCAKAARLSARQLTADRAAALTAEAEQIRGRAAALIDEDPRAYRAVIEQLRHPGGRGRGSEPMAAALSEATEVPMRLVELAVPIAGLAATLARNGKETLRGDALSAGLFAQASARAAATLVRINLAASPADPRHSRVDDLLAAIDEHLRS